MIEFILFKKGRRVILYIAGNQQNSLVQRIVDSNNLVEAIGKCYYFQLQSNSHFHFMC